MDSVYKDINMQELTSRAVENDDKCENLLREAMSEQRDNMMFKGLQKDQVHIWMCSIRTYVCPSCRRAGEALIQLPLIWRPLDGTTAH